MVLDRNEIIQDHGWTVEEQKQKIKEQEKLIEDLTFALVNQRHKFSSQIRQERAMRDKILQEWKNLHLEVTSARHYKDELDSLNRNVRRLAATGAKLTAIISSQSQQIKQLQEKH